MLPIKTVGIAIEIVGIFFMAMYIVFAFILMRQVRLMNDSLSTPVKHVFSLVALIHFLASLLIFSLAILAL